MTAYLMVVYDLYVLRDNDKLQDDVVRRLRDRVQFEGARYQLYVAATFVRAGCAFTFDDESDGNTVAEYYNRAVNEAPYDGREGGYQGPTSDTDEVLDDIVGDISRRDDVMEAIRDSFDATSGLNATCSASMVFRCIARAGSSSARRSSMRLSTASRLIQTTSTTVPSPFQRCSMRSRTSRLNPA